MANCRCGQTTESVTAYFTEHTNLEKMLKGRVRQRHYDRQLLTSAGRPIHTAGTPWQEDYSEGEGSIDRSISQSIKGCSIKMYNRSVELPHNLL